MRCATPSPRARASPAGNEAIAEFVKGAVHPVETVHHGHMAEIEITSATTARGVWAMEDKLRWPVGSPIRSMHGYGHYHETYEKIDGALADQDDRA